VIFYTSPDGSSWTQLGTTQSTAAGNIFSGTAQVEVGSNNTGSELLAGRVLRAQIYNGIDGTLAFDANFATASKLATSFTESSSNAATVTINTTGRYGARICGARDLVNMTAAEQPTYLPWSGTNYGWLNGVLGNYFSSPDSAVLDITGDIDLRGEIAPNTWTPGDVRTVVAKYSSAANNRSYRLIFHTVGGQLRLQTSPDGVNVVTHTSSVGTGFSAFSRAWVRATLDVDNGAGGNTCTFYTSTDGVIWTQLGTASTLAGTTSIFSGNAVAEVGSTTSGTFDPFNGSIYRAQIYNGINGTLAFDFNPAAYTSGTTFLESSVNAATITLNGGSVIVNRTQLYFDGTDDSLKAAAFALAQPEWVNFVGTQVTWTAGDYLYIGNAALSPSLRQSTSTPNIRINAGSDGTLVPGLALATRAISSAVFNGASSSLRINRGTPQTDNVGTNAANGFTLGSAADGTLPANITVNELSIYSIAPTTAQQDAWALYAGRKWGFSL
jgi:hypothetical protein